MSRVACKDGQATFQVHVVEHKSDGSIDVKPNGTICVDRRNLAMQDSETDEKTQEKLKKIEVGHAADFADVIAEGKNAKAVTVRYWGDKLSDSWEGSFCMGQAIQSSARRQRKPFPEPDACGRRRMNEDQKYQGLIEIHKGKVALSNNPDPKKRDVCSEVLPKNPILKKPKQTK